MHLVLARRLAALVLTTLLALSVGHVLFNGGLDKMSWGAATVDTPAHLVDVVRGELGRTTGEGCNPGKRQLQEYIQLCVSWGPQTVGAMMREKGVEVFAAAAIEALRAMPECNGRAGGVGFCFGGVLAYLFAATARPDGKGPDAAVSYYGSGVHGMLGLGDQIECPIMFHYGNRDAFIPGEQIDQVEAAMAGRPNVEFHRYDAGHAFSNWDAPSMYDQAAADEAWTRTLGFFSRLLRA